MPDSSPSPLPLPAGMRSTRAVQALLCVLPAQPAEGWTEAAVEQALAQRHIVVNRVTVYRALDRLAQAGLLLRSVDAQRTTRYWVAGASPARASAHMECSACHQSMALDSAASAVQTALQALRQAVAQTTGIADPRLDVCVQAECAQCTAATTLSFPSS